MTPRQKRRVIFGIFCGLILVAVLGGVAALTLWPQRVAVPAGARFVGSAMSEVYHPRRPDKKIPEMSLTPCSHGVQ